MEFENIRIDTNPTLSGRILVMVDIIYNNTIYDWVVYVPNGADIMTHLSENSTIYENDIDNKEAIWLSIPHIKTITDEYGNVEEIEILKSDIVKPTIPDELEKSPQDNIKGLQNTIQSLTKILSDNGIKIYTGDNNWHYPLFSKRIIAPIQLVLQQASFEVWFRLNGLPIIRENNTLYCYCNTILPQHQAIADTLIGVIIIEDVPE